jgi:hypothetical protein
MLNNYFNDSKVSSKRIIKNRRTNIQVAQRFNKFIKYHHCTKEEYSVLVRYFESLGQSRIQKLNSLTKNEFSNTLRRYLERKNLYLGKKIIDSISDEINSSEFKEFINELLTNNGYSEYSFTIQLLKLSSLAKFTEDKLVEMNIPIYMIEKLLELGKLVNDPNRDHSYSKLVLRTDELLDEYYSS